MTGLKIEITPDGITVDASGFQGKTCIDEIQKLLASLREAGIETEIIEQKLKSEYYVEQRGSAVNIK